MIQTTHGVERTPEKVDSFRMIVGRPETLKKASLERKAASPMGSLVILDHRALDRECLAQALVDRGLGMEVSAVGSVEEWREVEDRYQPVLAVLFNVGSRNADDPVLAEEISRLIVEFKPSPIVVLSDSDDLTQVVKLLGYGARGFIPSCVGVSVCVGAIGLAVAGGVFIPASSVMSMSDLVTKGATSKPRLLSGMFTHRQEAVVEALRRGKANKIIAYELNLRESTVKVHIRNIMKKLKATNRTEVAYKLNDMFPLN